jgi:FMN phosphatase YigB (HAD superfamily)
MKRIIFFDGDGTIWYPISTRRNHKPHWVYHSHRNPLPHLRLTPTTLWTLRQLRRKGVRTVLLSTHPHSVRAATSVLAKKVSSLNLSGLFDVVLPTRPSPPSKTLHIRRILKSYSIPKSQALMVGDSFRWDYQPARMAGIEALLFESAYRKTDPRGARIRRVITHTRDVLSYLAPSRPTSHRVVRKAQGTTRRRHSRLPRRQYPRSHR